MTRPILLLRVLTVLSALAAAFLLIRPVSKAQFNREEKAMVETIAKAEARAALQDERISVNAQALREVQLEIGKLQGIVNEFRSEISWLKGIGFGFGAFLSAVGALQLIFQLRRKT